MVGVGGCLPTSLSYTECQGVKQECRSQKHRNGRWITESSGSCKNILISDRETVLEISCRTTSMRSTNINDGNKRVYHTDINTVSMHFSDNW